MRVQIDTSETKGCRIPKCSRYPVYRHHKGCDHFIGRFNLDVKIKYHQFLDCADVCDHHHMIIHYMYGRTIKTWKDYTPSGALQLRATLIEYCDKILTGTTKLRRPSKAFVKEWKQRRRIWLKHQRQNRLER